MKIWCVTVVLMGGGFPLCFAWVKVSVLFQSGLWLNFKIFTLAQPYCANNCSHRLSKKFALHLCPCLIGGVRYHQDGDSQSHHTNSSEYYGWWYKTACFALHSLWSRRIKNPKGFIVNKGNHIQIEMQDVYKISVNYRNCQLQWQLTTWGCIGSITMSTKQSWEMFDSMHWSVGVTAKRDNNRTLFQQHQRQIAVFFVFFTTSNWTTAREYEFNNPVSNVDWWCCSRALWCSVTWIQRGLGPSGGCCWVQCVHCGDSNDTQKTQQTGRWLHIHSDDECRTCKTTWADYGD